MTGNNCDTLHRAADDEEEFLEMTQAKCAGARFDDDARLGASRIRQRVRRKQARHRLRYGDEVRMDNPHTWLYVEGKVGNDKVTSWSFEMGSPNGLVHRGWTRTALKEGDQVTVEGYCAKDGRNVANAGAVTMPDGRKLFGGFQSTPAPPPGSRVSGRFRSRPPHLSA